MHITMVKKIKADGSPCRKCQEVEQRLTDAHLLGRIDAIIVADERDPSSEGMQLAQRFDVESAPFFLVADGDIPPKLYTSYFRFLNEVLEKPASEEEELKEIMEQNDNLDFL